MQYIVAEQLAQHSTDGYLTTEYRSTATVKDIEKVVMIGSISNIENATSARMIVPITSVIRNDQNTHRNRFCCLSLSQIYKHRAVQYVQVSTAVHISINSQRAPAINVGQKAPCGEVEVLHL